jgi:hypothetical protein
MSIWQFSRILSQRLLVWNLVNLAAGLLLIQRGGFWRGVGSQCLGWGTINIGIALGGRFLTERRRSTLADPEAPSVVNQEARSLRRILWINAGLDVLYMLGGWRLAAVRGAEDAQWRGIGQGIMLQGGLLLLFDVIHALLVPDRS